MEISQSWSLRFEPGADHCSEVLRSVLTEVLIPRVDVADGAALLAASLAGELSPSELVAELAALSPLLDVGHSAPQCGCAARARERFMKLVGDRLWELSVSRHWFSTHPLFRQQVSLGDPVQLLHGVSPCASLAFHWSDPELVMVLDGLEFLRARRSTPESSALIRALSAYGSLAAARDLVDPLAPAHLELLTWALGHLPSSAPAHVLAVPERLLGRLTAQLEGLSAEELAAATVLSRSFEQDFDALLASTRAALVRL